MVKLEYKNRAEVKTLIIRIFAYSAMKIKANMLLLYSILNPETNSDSPSARSNGVRFVSASVVVNQQKKRGGIIKIIEKCGLERITEKLKDKR